jgi:hypothetical protein
VLCCFSVVCLVDEKMIEKQLKSKFWVSDLRLNDSKTKTHLGFIHKYSFMLGFQIFHDFANGKNDFFKGKNFGFAYIVPIFAGNFVGFFPFYLKFAHWYLYLFG